MKVTHGMSHSREYRSWSAMKTRCSPRNRKNPHLYYGRGIRVCKRWEKFENFFADMGTRPPNTTLDRIDVNGNYKPGNCRWASHKTQQNNKRSNIRVSFNGEMKTLSEWDNSVGLPPGTVGNRINRRGWNIHQALTRPLRWHPKIPYGTRAKKKRELCMRGHALSSDNIYILKRSLYNERQCKICKKDASRRYRLKNKSVCQRYVKEKR